MWVKAFKKFKNMALFSVVVITLASAAMAANVVEIVQRFF
jgi:hypothetical protein